MNKIFNLCVLIALLFGTANLVAENVNQSPLASANVYIVKKGDYLIRISKQFDVSIDSLKVWNKIKNISVIQINQRLTLVNPDIHPEPVATISSIWINFDCWQTFVTLENVFRATCVDNSTQTLDSNLDSLDLESSDLICTPELEVNKALAKYIRVAEKYNLKYNLTDAPQYTLQEIVESMKGKITYNMGRRRYSTGPSNTFYCDCSGFTELAAALYTGVKVPRTTPGIFSRSKKIDSDNLKDLPIGSLIGWPPSKTRHGHVYLKIGDGLYAHASSRGKKHHGASLTIVEEDIMQRRRGTYSLSRVALDDNSSLAQLALLQ